MSKQRIIFLTEEEIEALAKLCKSALKMTDISYFQRIEAEARSVLEKLEKQIREINDGK